MASEVVDILSDSDEEILFCGESPSKLIVTHDKREDERISSNETYCPVQKDPIISISPDEEEFPDVDFGYSLHNYEAPQLDIEFSFTRFTQLHRPQQPLIPAETLTSYPKPAKVRPSYPAVSPPVSPGKKKAPKTKEERAQEKLLKEREKAYEKALKAAQSANKKSVKAAECLKYVTVLVDSQILNTIPNSGNILTQLQESGMQHCIKESPVPNSVYWKRESLHHYVDSNNQVQSKSSIVEEEDAIVVVSVTDLINIGSSGSATTFTAEVLKNLKKTNLTLIVFGLNEYFRLQKLKGKQKFREACTGEKRKNKDNEELSLSAGQIEDIKVNLMLETQCSVWPVETSEELGKTIVRITKAIAERPFKEERLEQQFDFYAADVNGAVRVSKDGQGLTRLWQEQIQQFSLAALETAQAIVSKYRSPSSLIQAYQQCSDEKEASLLLQDIPVRRHAGPLSTSRRVGPELSKKVHKFLTGHDGKDIL